MNDIRDDPGFHFLICAPVAYAEIVAETRQRPPDSEATKRRAYQLYEAELRARGAGRSE